MYSLPCNMGSVCVFLCFCVLVCVCVCVACLTGRGCVHDNVMGNACCSHRSPPTQAVPLALTALPARVEPTAQSGLAVCAARDQASVRTCREWTQPITISRAGAQKVRGGHEGSKSAAQACKRAMGDSWLREPYTWRTH